MARMEQKEEKEKRPQREREDPEQETLVSRITGLPLVSSTYDLVSAAYSAHKEQHPYLHSVCGVAERGVLGLAAVAVSSAQPLLTRLEPQIATANEYACRGLDKLEEKLPFLHQPSEKVVSSARGAVSSGVSGMVDLARRGRRWSVELTSAVVAGGVDAALGTRVGRMVTEGVGAVLGRSEELLDHLLPLSDEELGKLAEAAGGPTVTSLEEQRRHQTYFVRLGSLSARLRRRAYQHSLGKLRLSKERVQEALAQLHETLELIEYVKQGVDHTFHSSQSKLHQLWQDWSRSRQEDERDGGLRRLQAESQTLALSCELTTELQATCETLASSIHGLPPAIQDKVREVRQNVEDLHAAFSAAQSFHDLSGAVLAQGRGQVTQAHESVDELVDYVMQNIPLPWLVGPFAPYLTERPRTPQNLAQQVDEVVPGRRPSVLDGDRWAGMEWQAQAEAWEAEQGLPPQEKKGEEEEEEKSAVAAEEEEEKNPVTPRVVKPRIMPELDF
ncbi:perilipin-5 isoform X2 [Ornithorhynchus anatinus]|uniref:perilipin-5 isoform X2 n=1 Tax=Ornithorhynchus anatinus TaxID=9258 RepID=UPI0010A7D880|nr:perilipin-5 isoform X2 [Ornithorhynchus anatinus]